MSKKRTKKSTNQEQPKRGGKKMSAAEPPPKPTHGPSEAATPRAARARDPRLPPTGTVIQKRDRQGNVRCECTVEEEGIRYSGTLYRSLTAAALAATKDLGTPMRSVNGFAWWGIVKPASRSGDPLAALERTWERYRDRAGKLVGNGVSDDNRETVRELLEKHADAIAELVQAVK